MPLAYPAYQRLLRGPLEFVTNPAEADVVVYGFIIDVDADVEVVEMLQRRALAADIVVMSEEPLWDSVWTCDFDQQETRTAKGIRVKLINHFNSTIYEYEYFPYFLTTSDDFLVRYRSLFQQFDVTKSPGAILRYWAKQKTRFQIFCERREDSRYAITCERGHLIGISKYRSELAHQLHLLGLAKVYGRGWFGAGHRQALPDWHLNKLTIGLGGSQLCGAMENTVAPHYVTEKPYDAIACLAIPVIFAPPDHSINATFGPCSLNLWGQSLSDSVDQVVNWTPSRELASDYCETVTALQKSFRSYRKYLNERARFAEGFIDCLKNV